MLACPFNYDNSSEIYTYLSDQVPCIYEVMVTEVFSGNLSLLMLFGGVPSPLILSFFCACST